MKPQNRGITLVLQGWLSRYLRLSLGLIPDNVGWIIVAMVIGAVIGIRLAKKLK